MRWRIGVGRRSISLGVLILSGVIAIVLGGGAVYARLGGLAGDPTTTINLQKGLIGWWKLDGDGKDSTPYSNTGVMTNGVSTADRKGTTGAAYTFNASASKMTLTNVVGQAGELTASVWYKRDEASSSSSWRTILGHKTANIHPLILNNVSRNLGIWDGAFRDFGYTVPNDGSWHNFTVIYNSAGNAKLYVDGTYVSQVTTTLNLATNPIGTIGNWAGGTYWAGNIDDVRIYDRALGATEIEALYKQYDAQLNAASGEKGLVGWWKLDGNAKDATPYGNNGTAIGATTAVDRKGTASSAYGFNGSSYIAIPSSSSLSVGNNITVSAWFYPTSGATYQPIVAKSASAGTAGWELANSSGVLRATLRGATLDVFGGTFSLNQWHMATFSYDGSTLRLYLDGVLKGTVAGTSTLNSTADLWIGKRLNGGDYFGGGSIDDVRMYNRPLSATEVARQYQSYNSQINLNSSPSSSQAYNINGGLVAYWPFNGNARDATPYQRDGTVSGATLTTDRKSVANRAYSFNGTGDYIDFGTDANYDYTDFTVSLWAKSNVAAPAHVTNLIGKGNWNNTNTWYLGFRNGTDLSFVYGTVWSSGPTYSLSNFTATQWHHYVGVATASQYKLYLDGNLVGSVSIAHGTTVNTLPLQIGRSSYINIYFGGSLDDVRLYKRALSVAEVQALYSSY